MIQVIASLITIGLMWAVVAFCASRKDYIEYKNKVRNHPRYGA